MKHEYQLHDDVWIYAGVKDANGNEILSQAKVIGIFNHDLTALQQYIIRANDPDIPHHKVRDVFCMTDDPANLPRYARPKKGSTGATEFDPASNEVTMLDPDEDFSDDEDDDDVPNGTSQ
jgi:hypothetical protein